MQRLTNEQKAKVYNELLFKYQKLQEEVRNIKMKNFEVSDEDHRRILVLESNMKKIYNEAEKLY
jgi:glutamate mutase epsilon subunit